VKALRAKFLEATLGLDAMTLHFLDECGVHDAMVPLRGRAPRGQRAIGTKPRARGNHLTVVGRLSMRDGLTAQPWPGPMRRDDFLSWVESDLVPHLRPGDTVVMDNCSIHKGPEIVDLIEATGAKVAFLAPYSPDHNPIEEAWSKFKELLRRAKAATIDELCEAIARAALCVTQADIRGYIGHVGFSVSN
jgi:transposase